MKRRLAGFLSGLMLVSFVCSCVIWRTSYLPGASKAPSTFAMQTMLARTLPALRFDAVGLTDVLDFYRDVSGSNIVVDWPAMERTKIDRNEAVSASLRNVPMGQALTAITSQVKADFHTLDQVIFIHPAGQSPRVWRTHRAPQKPLARPYARPIESTIPYMVFDRSPLEDVLNYLHTTQGVPIDVDWGSLSSAGVTRRTPISFQVRNEPLSLDLSLILTQCTDKDDVQFEVRDSGIYIATRSEFDRSQGPPPSWWRWPNPASTAAVTLAAVLLLLALWRVSRLNHQEVSGLRWVPLAAIVIVATIGGFATWHHGPPSWEFVHRDTRWTLTADRGAVQFYKTPADPATPYRNAATNTATLMFPAKPIIHSRAGFYLRRQGWPADSFNIQAPAWSLVVVTSIVPLAWLVATLKRRKLYLEGKCPHCGYDLRASQDRCPECGSPITRQTQ